jgi:hypothetical protein
MFKNRTVQTLQVNILSRVSEQIRRLDCQLDLLESYDSILQVTTTISRIYIHYKSLYCSTHKVFFTSRCLVTTIDNG